MVAGMHKYVYIYIYIYIFIYLFNFMTYGRSHERRMLACNQTLRAMIVPDQSFAKS